MDEVTEYHDCVWNCITRVEVWLWIFVRNAVKWVKFRTSFCGAVKKKYFTKLSGVTATENAVKKKIHRDSPHSPQKDVRNTRWKLFFFHRISQQFTVSSMNSPCWTFLTWISASADFFCQTRHHQTAHCRQSPSATIFYCLATFTHFLKLFKSFKQNR